MPEPNTSETTEQQATETAKAVATGPTPEEFAALKSENEKIVRERDEFRNSAEFWSNKATGKAEAPPKKEAEPEPDEDPLEMFSTKGMKGLRDWMKKEGYISRAEAEKLTVEHGRQLIKEASLTQKYPDLQRPSSEFFKATAKHYQELKGSVPDSLVMELAAERAELNELRTAKAKPGAGEESDDRKERARAQSGDSGRRKGAPVEDDEPAPLTATDLAMCASLGVDPKAVQARAKKYVGFEEQRR